MPQKIATTVFTGFLGAGKTTIILYLVEQLQKSGEKVAYIKNELGDETTDGAIIERTHIKTKELFNGCICCTLTGPFVHAVDELVETVKPDRILIEASGNADPTAVALMVSSHSKLKRDGVICIVDVVNFEAFPDLSYTAREQAKFTDLIVFNKVELVSLERKLQVVGYVREVNEYSPIIEAPQGKVSPEVIFGLTQREIPSLHHHDHHLETDQMRAATEYIQETLSVEELTRRLSVLPQNIFRVKGIVRMPDGGWKLVNKVGERITIEPLEGAFDQKSYLVYIGFGEF
jgi:G3E family GTPase